MISLSTDGAPIQTTQGIAHIVSSTLQIDAELWTKTLAGHCLDSRYYDVTEETLRNRFDFRYAILTNERTGATAVQPFFFVDQDISAGLPPQLRALLARSPGIARHLNLKMLVVGSAAGEGRLDCTEAWAVETLTEALEEYADQAQANLILFKDFPAEYRTPLADLQHRGYKRVPSMPAVTLDLNFSSFEEYLQLKLGRGFRSNLRRKLRDNEKRGHLTMEVVHDVTPYLGEIYPLYLQTYGRSPFRFEKLSKQYFSQLGRHLPERTHYFLWRQEGRILAFALCMVHDGVLHYLNIGMGYPEALERHLYFVVWRDLVAWALNTKLHRIEIGPLNYEAKFRLGLEIAPRDLYARHTSPVLNPLFGVALRFLQPARHDPALGKFPNADALA